MDIADCYDRLNTFFASWWPLAWRAAASWFAIRWTHSIIHPRWSNCTYGNYHCAPWECNEARVRQRRLETVLGRRFPKENGPSAQVRGDCKLHTQLWSKKKYLLSVLFGWQVVESKFTLYFKCSEETLLERLLKRGESSGRADDNIDSIKKRFQTFKDTSYPVIEYYEKQGKVREVSYSLGIILVGKSDAYLMRIWSQCRLMPKNPERRFMKTLKRFSMHLFNNSNSTY